MAVFLTPSAITLSAASAWTDADVSASVPSGATGVILHIEKTVTAARTIGLRKNGSTDNRTNNFSTNGANDGHFWACIGVDSSRIFEYFVGSTTEVIINLVGYFTSDAVFFDNAVSKATGTTFSYVDADISADTGTDTALAAVIETITNNVSNQVYLRKNGSTDDFKDGFGQHIFSIVGVDGSEIFEQYISSTTVDTFLVGYITANVTMHTNATSRATATTGSYEDVAALPSGAIGGIYTVVAAGQNNALDYAVRKNGSSEDIYRSCSNVNPGAAIVECDGSLLVEQKIAGAAVDLYESGYFTAPAVAAARPLAALGVGT